MKKEVRVAITGAGSCIFRSKELESALSNNFSSSAIDNIYIEMTKQGLGKERIIFAEKINYNDHF